MSKKNAMFMIRQDKNDSYLCIIFVDIKKYVDYYLFYLSEQ